MPQLILCRHAATTHNIEHRFLSTTDLPLSVLGHRQCQNLRDRLKNHSFSRVLCSPSLRARQTADAIAGDLTVEINADLREIDFGSWEGLTAGDVEQRFPGQLTLRAKAPAAYRPPGGESFLDVALRLKSLSYCLLQTQDSMLVVSHRGTLAVLERLLRGIPVDSSNIAAIETADYHVVDLTRISCPDQSTPSGDSKTSCQ
jgi:broad specificity phosphatase PhoE